MPIHVNEHAITALATLLGADPAALKSELVVDAPEAPKETRVNDLLKNVVVLGTTAYDEEKKKKYDEGRNAAISIPLEQSWESLMGEKKKFTFTRYEDAAAAQKELADAYAAKKIKDAGIEPDKRVASLTQDVDALRNQLADKDKLLNSAKEKEQAQEIFWASKNTVVTAIASVPLSAEGQTAAEQRKAIETLFFAQYEIKSENSREVVYRKGTDERVLTNLREPLPVADVVKGIITTLGFPTTAATSGRGDQSSGTNTNAGQNEAIPGDIKTLQGLKAWMTAKGIAERSQEYKAALTEFYLKNPEAK